jgi:signal transduction histidine kinase
MVKFVPMDLYSWSLLTTCLASLALGIFVFLKGANKIPNRTLALFSASLALWCLGQFMGGRVAAKELILLWTRTGIAGAIFIPVFFLHFILSLVERDGKEKNLIYSVYGIGIIFWISNFTSLFVAEVGPVLNLSYYPRPGALFPFFAIFVLVCFAYGFFRLLSAYKDSSGVKRNQLLYIFLACLIGFPGGVTTFFPVWNINVPVISHVTLPFYIIITMYAILKHRLLDISIIIREGLVYSTLTILFAGFYALAVLTTNYLFSSLVHFPPALAVFSVVFISVLVFQPVRDKVQRGVDRLFFRGEYQYLKTIGDLSAENQKLFRSLLQADKLAALGTISAGMAHEIKNPLASIKGLTQVLEGNLEDPGFIKRYQEIVSRQIDRINNLIEKLLKFGQPQELSLSKFNLNQVIEEVLSLLEKECQKKRILVSRDFAGLPHIQGDSDQLSQVFMNFALNAVQAMPEGGRLSIKSYARGSNSVYVEVSDTGVGIPAEKLHKRYDPFFRTKDKGTGMGLAVAYRIIKEHGGETQVESQVGKGTKFKLWLPIRPALLA